MKKKINIPRNFLRLLIGFYIFITLMLIGVGGILFKWKIGSFGDLFSFGQLLVDLCILPFAILAFFMTLEELRKSQEFVDLVIGWDTPIGMVNTFSVPSSRPASWHTPKIMLKNNGTSPSLTYQITLEIPTEAGRVNMTETNWKSSRQKTFEKFIFTSAAHFVSFPDAPAIDLGSIIFIERGQFIPKLSVAYHISSDKGEYKHGELFLNFTKPN